MSDELPNAPFMHKDQWLEYAVPSDNSFLGYAQCTDELVEYLDDLLAKSTTFEELKNELTQLRDNRRKFADYASTHVP